MTIGIVGNTEKANLPEVLRSLVQTLEERKIRALLHRDLSKVFTRADRRTTGASVRVVSDRELARRSDVLISLGGDGTMLRTARLVAPREVPILGVNLGKMGFLAEVSVEDIRSAIDDLQAGRTRTEARMRLVAQGKGLKRGYSALNDIVVNMPGIARVVHIETFVDNEYVATFTGDGIMVSTPTGSTGYALSNGGPIITPDQSVMMISPICPHNLTARPIVVPDTVTVDLRVVLAPGRVHVTADGQPATSMHAPLLVRIRKAPHRTMLVKRSGRDYFDVLRNKLGWGKDLRTEPVGS
jgi:NAD+ kinase